MDREEMQARYDELCAKDDEQGGLSDDEQCACVELYYELNGDDDE